MTTPLYEVTDLSVAYNARNRRQPTVALRGVSFSVRAGETLGVVGESGSGKSSLANAMMGLVPAAHGTCRFEGRDIATMNRADTLLFRRSVQMVFQDPFGSLNPRLTVGDAIGEVIRVHDRAAATVRATLDGRVAGLLGQVDLTPAHASRYPHELSGGQRQRVVLARALAVNPVLLIADEPVSALDVLIQRQVLALLASIQRERNMALVLIAHDLAVVHNVCGRLLVLFGGLVMESGPSTLLSHAAHPYTRNLLSSVPSVTRGLARDRRTAGRPLEPEQTDRLPPDAQGCPYRPQCGMATERCENEAPELSPVGLDHFSRCHFAIDTFNTHCVERSA
jgi:oligopeptide/dipeptide ABC transporter ATP-binding protein